MVLARIRPLDRTHHRFGPLSSWNLPHLREPPLPPGRILSPVANTTSSFSAIDPHLHLDGIPEARRVHLRRKRPLPELVRVGVPPLRTRVLHPPRPGRRIEPLGGTFDLDDPSPLRPDEVRWEAAPEVQVDGGISCKAS